MQDELEIEDFLWRYIKIFFTDKLNSIFTPDIKYFYFSHKLVIESESSEAVKNASEEVVILYQKVADYVVEEKFQLPQDADETVLRNKVKDFTEKEKVLVRMSHGRMCHIVGSKESVLSFKKRLLDVTSADVTKTVKADENRKWVVSEAVKSRPVYGNTPDSYSLTTPGGIRVAIYQGDLVHETVDVIVNPANSWLKHGSGAARAIADAAGSQLQHECKVFIGQHKRLNVTEMMHTSAGNLRPKINYVIHAVGPRAAEFLVEAELLKALRMTFLKCLQYADMELHASSVSVPAISSGMCFSRD